MGRSRLGIVFEGVEKRRLWNGIGEIVIEFWKGMMTACGLGNLGV